MKPAPGSDAVAPRVSIVIPTYNRMPLLRDAVASILEQTYQDWELIIVDDGSTDATDEYLAELSQQSKIHVIFAAHSGNVARARNVGAAAASGFYLAFLDSDDEWLPDKLRVQIREMESAGARWSYTRFHLTTLKRQPAQVAGTDHAPSGRIIDQLLRTTVAVGVVTIVVERQLFEVVGGFDEELTGRDDFDLTLRLATAADVHAIQERLVRIREHTQRTTRHWTNPHALSARAYEKFLQRTDLPGLRITATRILANHLAEAGAYRLGEGAIMGGLRDFSRSLQLGPDARIWLSALRRGTTRALTNLRIK